MGPSPDGDVSPRRATLRDVARAAGVSPSTTSRALSGEGYVAPAVRERVRSAADRLGYVPHAMARSLRTAVSRTVGVVVPDLRQPFAADLAAGVAARARTTGYTVTLVDPAGSAEEERTAARALVAARCAGVVLAPRAAGVAAYLREQRVPVVEAGRREPAADADAVVVDVAGATTRLVEHLARLGHRRIALLTQPDDAGPGTGLAGVWAAALAGAGLPARPPLVVAGARDADAAHRSAVALLARREGPTAVLAGDDVLAEGLWRAVGDLGLRVPEDVSLAALADARWMALVTPAVTAVAADVVALGAAAMDRLLARLAAPTGDRAASRLDAPIVPRGSTGPVRRDEAAAV